MQHIFGVERATETKNDQGKQMTQPKNKNNTIYVHCKI
jgi:hypothetical protein